MAGADLAQLGRYKILAELGRGAMGVVYRAQDPLLDRIVAIKTIILSANAEERAEYEARFYQEAKAAGGLSHPHLITIFDIGREGDTAYMAMELLEGTDLRELMKQDRVPLPLALELAAQVAEGLAYAHEYGVVHRDIKPANVMVIRGRHAKIMDFGIARIRVSDIQTQTGAMLGSPKYMSPEQVTGLRADHRSDIFSLGILLYELASGAPPFAAPTVTGLMNKIATATPPPPSAADASLPPMLDLITAKALQKEPDARYQSAAELAADLRECLAQVGDATGAMPSTVPPRAEKTAARKPAPSTGVGERTAKVDPDAPGADGTNPAEATRLAARERARTRRSDGATGAPRISAGAVIQLYLSRKAESSEAMARLEAMTADGQAGSSADAGSDRPGFIRRFWDDIDRRVFAMAMVLAVVCAALIALTDILK